MLNFILPAKLIRLKHQRSRLFLFRIKIYFSVILIVYRYLSNTAIRPLWSVHTNKRTGKIHFNKLVRLARISYASAFSSIRRNVFKFIGKMYEGVIAVIYIVRFGRPACALNIIYIHLFILRKHFYLQQMLAPIQRARIISYLIGNFS